MKRKTYLNLLGYALLVLAFISFVVAVSMDTGKQFWMVTGIAVSYLALGGFVFNVNANETKQEGF